MKIISLIFLNLLLLGCNHQVKHVYDGDSFVLENGQHIRLYGIDAPEAKQKYGHEAEHYLKSLILERDLEIKKIGKGYYNRTLAIVYVDDKNVNTLMLENGYAWVYDKYCKKDWNKFEKRARQKYLGLWSQKNPKEPWKFRNENQ